ncbi:hypothetical protein L218DRAFT_953012 [Marasmius fiardii PR-910]|nr:hypothetical protein L218DRAFT_953012 [Marasmius fiardii PR-910]
MSMLRVFAFYVTVICFESILVQFEFQVVEIFPTNKDYSWPLLSCLLCRPSKEDFAHERHTLDNDVLLDFYDDDVDGEKERLIWTPELLINLSGDLLFFSEYDV